jgi:hypothetical protein
MQVEIAIGAVLRQYNGPVAYFSENLNETKEKYSTYDKEFYAVIQDLKKWRHYLIPKEFVLYSDNQTLQFITRQEKLNQRHAKWVEFTKNFNFFIKHISISVNKVADALRRRSFVIQEFQVKTLEFEHLKEMYKEDSDFKEAYEEYENYLLRDNNSWSKYLIQNGLFFKGSQLSIPRCSMRDNLLKEKHSGGLVRLFGHDKTFAQLSSLYYWPGMRECVKKFVD